MPDKQVQTDGKRSAQSTLVPTITPPRSKSSTAYQRSQGTSSSISGVTISVDNNNPIYWIFLILAIQYTQNPYIG
jgi:hypothetical protein